jgi:hypothetical protein
MSTTRLTIVVVVALVIGAGGVWYVRSGSQMETSTVTETTAITAVAPAAAQTRTSEAPVDAAPESVADVIDGYDGMSRAEKSKAVRTLMETTQDRAVLALLNKEYDNLFFDGGEHANQRFEGVVPDGWKTE